MIERWHISGVNCAIAAVRDRASRSILENIADCASQLSIASLQLTASGIAPCIIISDFSYAIVRKQLGMKKKWTSELLNINWRPSASK